MLEVVQALEGPIAPMECFHEEREGKVLCSHEADAGRACATKVLWTRVQGGVTKALAGTSLAELVKFANQHERSAPWPGASRAPKPGRKETWPISRSGTCTYSPRARRSCGASTSRSAGRDARVDGPQRLRQVDARQRDPGSPRARDHRGPDTYQGDDITDAAPDERARMGLFMAFQYPVAIPGVTVSKYLRMVINAQREHAARIRSS